MAAFREFLELLAAYLYARLERWALPHGVVAAAFAHRDGIERSAW